MTKVPSIVFDDKTTTAIGDHKPLSWVLTVVSVFESVLKFGSLACFGKIWLGKFVWNMIVSGEKIRVLCKRIFKKNHPETKTYEHWKEIVETLSSFF